MTRTYLGAPFFACSLLGHTNLNVRITGHFEQEVGGAVGWTGNFGCPRKEDYNVGISIFISANIF